MWGISLLHPVLPSFLSGKFYVGSFSYTSRVAFIFIWEVSLTHPVLVSFSFFLFFISCCLYFSAWSFSYTSRVACIVIWEGLGAEFLLHIPCWLRIWIVSLTYPLLALFLSGEFLPNNLCWLHFLSGEFLLHIPCWLCFYVVSLCYTSRVTFIFIWEGLCGEFLLHIPCCLHFYLRRFMWEVSLTHPVLPSFLSGKVYVGSFSYTSRVAFIFIWEGLCGEFLLHIPCWLRFSFTLGVSLTHPVLVSFFSFLFYPDSFPYISPAGFILIWWVSPKQPMLASFFIWGVSLTHPMLTLFLCGEFVLHIPCYLHFYLGRFMWGVSLTHPVLPSFVSGKVYLGSFSYTSRAFYLLFFLFFYLGSFSYISHAGFIFIVGVFLTHPVLALVLSGEFLLHIPCCLHLYLGRFMWGVSLTHPVLFIFFFFLFFLSREFLLHIPCWIHFHRGSFSYTSRAGFSFIWGVSLTHPMLASFLS